MCPASQDWAGKARSVRRSLGCVSTPVYVLGPVGGQEGPPRTAVHEDKVFIFPPLDDSAVERPPYGAPVEAVVPVVLVPRVGGQRGQDLELGLVLHLHEGDNSACTFICNSAIQ